MKRIAIRTREERGTEAPTHLEVVHEVGYRKTTCDDGDCQQRMFQRCHVVACVVLVLGLLILSLRCGLARVPRMEHLIQAVTARVDLKRIREHDEDDDGQLTHCDEQRSGRVHGNDVGTNLRSGG